MSQSESASSGPPPDTSVVSLDQLDTLVRVTTLQAWVSLGTLFAVCAGAIVFAVLYQVPRKVSGEGILLIKHDRLSQVRALGTGRLKTLRVSLGQEVHLDEQIGEIYQDDLKAAIHETEERLKELRREDDTLTEFEDKERETQDHAIDRLKAAIDKLLQNSREGLRVAEKIVDGSTRLRSLSQLSNLDWLKDLQQMYAIQNDFNNGQSRLAELQLTRVASENQRRRAGVQRRLEIKRQETRLRLDREKLGRTSRIVAHVRGTVAQVLTGPDELVREGAPVVLLSSPETDPGTDDPGKPYESIVFVSAGEGKKINVGDRVEVMPATVKREEYGYIRGTVVSVSELPATRLAMEAALQHPDLVDTFLKRYAPGVLLRVYVHLKPDPLSPGGNGEDFDETKGNRFLWSSRSGASRPLKTGTMCEAAIVVERQPLIGLVIPWIKGRLDLD
jgi:HlyD family secretion protein